MVTMFLAASALVLTQAPAADPCEATAGHHGYTLLLQENGHFAHCRHGQGTDEEPVSHERVVLQLPPEGPDHPFRYRLFDPRHPEAGHKSPLLRRQIEIIEGYENELHDLANAPESVGETLQRLAPGEAPPAGTPAAAPRRETAAMLAAEAAQAKYLGYATPAFVEAAHALRADYGKLKAAAGEIDAVCHSSAGKVRAGAVRESVDKVCAGGPGDGLLRDLAPFEALLEAYSANRHEARDAVIAFQAAAAGPAADAEAREATQKLEAATQNARQLIVSAHAAAGRVADLLRDARLLRAAVSLPAAEEGERILLGHFSANGLFSAPDIYQVHVLQRPSRFFTLDEPPQTEEQKAAEREILVDRFQPASRNYVDIGLALMYSAGLPDHPTLTGQLGHQTLDREKTAGFNGGVLLSLEPLEFSTLPDPWAQILHFPTIIIPFTLDPTKNYFIGAGVGILDVASIDVGAHLALTTVPAPGHYYGETFNTSPIDINHVTTGGPVAGGWFVSLSIDLVGVVHLIVDQLKPTVRDVGSNAPVGEK